METPAWVNDNPLIVRLLSSYLDKRERNVRLTIRINQKSAHELFNFEQNTEALWALISHNLAKEHALLRIQLKRKKRTTAEDYDGAMLYFDGSEKTETLVRHWLNRPKKTSYLLQWQQALTHLVVEKPAALSSPIEHKHKTAMCIIQGFNQAQQQLSTLKNNNDNITLRGLSARCFWGDSKFLDEKRKLLNVVFPSYFNCIEARPIMLSAYIPEQFNNAIFVENFDSFCSLSQVFMGLNKTAISSINHDTAIIYSAGFKSSAKRSREQGNSLFVAINAPSSDAYNAFNNWWFNIDTPNIDCFFWGDFDYSAMSILHTLRQNFATITAWETGYQLILAYHQNGLGHAPQDSKKQDQRAPHKTGCAYADQHLLPLMHQSQRFIDQEIVSKSELKKILSGSLSNNSK